MNSLQEQELAKLKEHFSSMFEEIKKTRLSQFNEALERARDKNHILNKLKYPLSGDIQQANAEIQVKYSDAVDKYLSDKNIELIDAFLEIATDKREIENLAKYLALNEVFDTFYGYESIEDDSEKMESGREFTIPRQVIALHYIFEELRVQANFSRRAEFVCFLTGKNYKNTYNALLSPFADKKRDFRRTDLEFVLQYFESLGHPGLINKIKAELSKK